MTHLLPCYPFLCHVPTERLYFSDPFLHPFTGYVIAHAAWHGTLSVVLERTAF